MIGVIMLGRQFGHDRLRAAVALAVAHGACDPGAVRYLLTAGELRAIVAGRHRGRMRSAHYDRPLPTHGWLRPAADRPGGGAMTPPGGATVDLHDQVIRQNCRTLKTPAIAAQYQGLAEAAAREGHSHVRYLDALLGAEIDERERKAVLRRVKEARLPRLKTLQEFDFAQSPVSAARIADLAAGGYIARAEPVLLIGEAGTGKTHLPRGCVSPPASSAAGCASPPPTALVNELVEAAPPTP